MIQCALQGSRFYRSTIFIASNRYLNKAIFPIYHIVSFINNSVFFLVCVIYVDVSTTKFNQLHLCTFSLDHYRFSLIFGFRLGSSSFSPSFFFRKVDNFGLATLIPWRFQLFLFFFLFQKIVTITHRLQTRPSTDVCGHRAVHFFPGNRQLQFRYALTTTSRFIFPLETGIFAPWLNTQSTPMDISRSSFIFSSFFFFPVAVEGR